MGPPSISSPTSSASGAHTEKSVMRSAQRGPAGVRLTGPGEAVGGKPFTLAERTGADQQGDGQDVQQVPQSDGTAVLAAGDLVLPAAGRPLDHRLPCRFGRQP